ncbi:MAG: hypothetical protein KDG54_11210 [Geminicoccaceae bacterium]|nr:hypothetical protein [Geminicoccaceae bacterium]
MTDQPTEWVASTMRGYALYRRPNGVGGHTCYSDEIGGGVLAWDTSLVDRETMLAFLMIEDRRLAHELTITASLANERSTDDDH